MTGMPITRLAISSGQGRRPSKPKIRMARTITRSRKLVPQRGCSGGYFGHTFDRKRIARLVGMDRHVFGPVIGRRPG